MQVIFRFFLVILLDSERFFSSLSFGNVVLSILALVFVPFVVFVVVVGCSCITTARMKLATEV